jgi:hypothetical protein
MDPPTQQSWEVIVPIEDFASIKTTNKAIFDEYIAKGFCGMSEVFRTEVYPNHHCPGAPTGFWLWLYTALKYFSCFAILVIVLIGIVALVCGTAECCGCFGNPHEQKAQHGATAAADPERGEIIYDSLAGEDTASKVEMQLMGRVATAEQFVPVQMTGVTAPSAHV